MRYLFRGLIRDTGGPVEGHVEAAIEDDAYSALSENGIVTESLIPDPKPLNLNEELPASPEFADALESAFDSSSSQVDFDALNEKYHGKKVWVIDRDKIRRRVAQVVDAALALSHMHGEGAGEARERVASAIQGLFNDNRNLATQRNAESVAGMRLNSDSMAGIRFNAPPPTPPPPPPAWPAGNGGAAAAGARGIPTAGHPALEQQISRLANLVKQAEATLTAVAAAARRGGGDGGGGPRRRAIAAPGRGQEQNSVLLEIFKSNLELVRGMQDPTGAAAAAPAGDLSVGPVAESPAPATDMAADPSSSASAGPESQAPEAPAVESLPMEAPSESPSAQASDSDQPQGAEEIPERPDL